MSITGVKPMHARRQGVTPNCKASRNTLRVLIEMHSHETCIPHGTALHALHYHHKVRKTARAATQAMIAKAAVFVHRVA